MERANWTPFRVHGYFLDRPCRCCATRDLGLFTEHLERGRGFGSQANVLRAMSALDQKQTCATSLLAEFIERQFPWLTGRV